MALMTQTGPAYASHAVGTVLLICAGDRLLSSVPFLRSYGEGRKRKTALPLFLIVSNFEQSRQRLRGKYTGIDHFYACYPDGCSANGTRQLIPRMQTMMFSKRRLASDPANAGPAFGGFTLFGLYTCLALAGSLAGCLRRRQWKCPRCRPPSQIRFRARKHNTKLPSNVGRRPSSVPVTTSVAVAPAACGGKRKESDTTISQSDVIEASHLHRRFCAATRSDARFSTSRSTRRRAASSKAYYSREVRCRLRRGVPRHCRVRFQILSGPAASMMKRRD